MKEISATSMEEYLLQCPPVGIENSETRDVWLDSNQALVKATPEKLINDEISLLNRLQEVVWVQKCSLYEKIESMNCKSTPSSTALTPMHSFIYQKYFKDSHSVVARKWLAPTLSLRTLILDKGAYLKFGLPFTFGGGPRHLTRNEVLRSLFFSDLTSHLKPIHKLTYMQDTHGYCSHLFRNFSILERRHDFHHTPDHYIPIGCAFGALLKNFLSDKSKREMEKIHHFSLMVTKDISRLCLELLEQGVGLEMHGQNLLINESYTSLGSKYLYRDMGNCSFNPQVYTINNNHVLDYYHQKYEHEFSFNADDVLHTIWRIYRSLVFSFLGYNLEKYVFTNQRNGNIYSELIASSDPEIRKIVSL